MPRDSLKVMSERDQKMSIYQLPVGICPVVGLDCPRARLVGRTTEVMPSPSVVTSPIASLRRLPSAQAVQILRSTKEAFRFPNNAEVRSMAVRFDHKRMSYGTRFASHLSFSSCMTDHKEQGVRPSIRTAIGICQPQHTVHVRQIRSSAR